jgi:trigger factor
MPEEQQTSAPKNTVTIEQTGPCKKKVIIEVPEQTIKSSTDEQYKTLQKEALVPGFRKGRAPRRLLEKRFGKETTDQIKLKLIAEASDSAIKDNKLDVIGEPDIDFEKKLLFNTDLNFHVDLDGSIISDGLRQKFEENNTPLSPRATASVEQAGSIWLITDELKKYPVRKENGILNIYEEIELPKTGPLKFDFEVEVWPEFELPSLEGIAVTRTKLAVTEGQIDREIEQLRRWSGVWTPREEGAVESGDQLIADAVLKVEGAEAEQKLDNAEIFVRRNGFVAGVPIEGLDELLVGAKTGDTKQTSVEVPKTYFREEYRGKKIDIRITIKDIKWLKTAELDENLLKKYGAANEDELREKTRDMLHGRLEQQTRAEMTEQIYKHLLSNTNFDLPLNLVAEQASTLLQRQYVNLMMRGLSRQQIDEQMDKLHASSEEQAKEQLKAFFVMGKVADKLGIEVTEEEINGHIAQLAIQQNQRPERLKEDMTRNGSLAQFKLEVRQSKCIAKLLESAKVTEKEQEKEPEKPVPAKAVEKAQKPVKKAVKKASGEEKKQTKTQKTATKKKTKDKKAD